MHDEVWAWRRLVLAFVCLTAAPVLDDVAADHDWLELLGLLVILRSVAIWAAAVELRRIQPGRVKW
jgi:hypothetical protein